jgi:hypothetical protein
MGMCNSIRRPHFAALGSVSGNMGAGAALGAGTGLVAGSAIGADNGDIAGGSLQARYDTLYAQCMSAKGNRIGGPPAAEPVFAYPPRVLAAGSRHTATGGRARAAHYRLNL